MKTFAGVCVGGPWAGKKMVANAKRLSAPVRRPIRAAGAEPHGFNEITYEFEALSQGSYGQIGYWRLSTHEPLEAMELVFNAYAESVWRPGSDEAD